MGSSARMAMSRGFVVSLLFAVCGGCILLVSADPRNAGGDEMTRAMDEMAQMDSNKDGAATLEEIKSYIKRHYYNEHYMRKRAEQNNGKKHTAEETEKMIEKDAQELMKELDKDKSGELSVQELKAQHAPD